MPHHTNRPVRHYTKLIEDTVPETKPRPRYHREMSPMEAIDASLENLSTQQLRALCVKECPGVSTKLGPGARERFLKALVIKRLDRMERKKRRNR